MQGCDSIALHRVDIIERGINFLDLANTSSAQHLQLLEFKGACFNLGLNGQGRRFNHPLVLTDIIIAWDLQLDGKSTTLVSMVQGCLLAHPASARVRLWW